MAKPTEKRKLAFTLIELLVVIAIVSILAAILFPVFAQAKSAAKRVASLSRIKQITLAEMIYSADYDDRNVAIASWPSSDGSNRFLEFRSAGGIASYEPWPVLLDPYEKTVDILLDPQAPPLTPLPDWTHGSTLDLRCQQWYAPEYGINPYLVSQANYPYISQYSWPPFEPLLSRDETAVSRPAQTVLFTQQESTGEWDTQIVPTQYQWYGYFWWGINTAFMPTVINPPDGASLQGAGNRNLTGGGWNRGSLNSILVDGKQSAGAWTGGGTMRGNLLMLVTFADGHAALKPPGYLAEGTNYSNSTDGDGIPIQNQTEIIMTDMTKEHYYGQE
jgi:prepilin-type N-terminal cleavage/methylation domain-containing protein